MRCSTSARAPRRRWTTDVAGLGPLVAGTAAAGVIAWAAQRAGSLDARGAWAATAIGAAAMAAGPSWGALLIGYFVASSLLSRVGAAAKAARTGAIVEKGGARDAVQVAANGGIFALAALASVVTGEARWMAVGGGALAASAADTWATEIGTWLGGTPRHLLTWRPVPPGTSGGVTLAGSLGMLAGAAFVALAARALGWPAWLVAPVIAGGVAGALGDTVLGALLQARRRCPACGTPTERLVHACGTPTVAAGGLSWMDNDVVNGAAGLVGALVAAWAAGVQGAIS